MLLWSILHRKYESLIVISLTKCDFPFFNLNQSIEIFIEKSIFKYHLDPMNPPS